jgi:hypothetical protein
LRLSRTIAARRVTAKVSNSPSKCIPTSLSLTCNRGFSSMGMPNMSKSFHALVLGGFLLVGGPFVQSLSAQDGKNSEKGPAYSGASEIAFEWQYSCTNGKGCSFNCPGSGGAANVTKLAIHLETIPLSGSQRTLGIFYEFSTMEIPRANGFSVTTGIGTLSCQVNGMNLDYSGPPKSLEAAR